VSCHLCNGCLCWPGVAIRTSDILVSNSRTNTNGCVQRPSRMHTCAHSHDTRTPPRHQLACVQIHHPAAYLARTVGLKPLLAEALVGHHHHHKGARTTIISGLVCSEGPGGDGGVAAPYQRSGVLQRQHPLLSGVQKSMLILPHIHASQTCARTRTHVHTPHHSTLQHNTACMLSCLMPALCPLLLACRC